MNKLKLTQYILFFNVVQIFYMNAFDLKPYEQYWQINFETYTGENENSKSSIRLRNHIKDMNYKSILDIPCRLCPNFFGFKNNNIDIDYTGVDFTPKFIVNALQKNVNVKLARMEKIPFDNESFDIVYSHHSLEHLDYYEKAISELIRVARKEVFIVFFLRPSLGFDDVKLIKSTGCNVYYNHYNKSQLELFITSHPKVKKIEWEDSSFQETIAIHIYLN